MVSSAPAQLTFGVLIGCGICIITFLALEWPQVLQAIAGGRSLTAISIICGVGILLYRKSMRRIDQRFDQLERAVRHSIIADGDQLKVVRDG